MKKRGRVESGSELQSYGKFERREGGREGKNMKEFFLASESADAQMGTRRALCTMRSVVLKLSLLETSSLSLQGSEAVAPLNDGGPSYLLVNSAPRELQDPYIDPHPK